ncbi:MAG: HAD family hydrolase [Bacteroidaceae bacterium]|nr:HAD family hydrolase [Bacteroidaceae bacterium]
MAFDFGGTIDTPFLHWMKVYIQVYNSHLHLNLTSDNFREAYVHAEREMERLQLVKPTDGLLQTQRYKTHLQFDYLANQGMIASTLVDSYAEQAAQLVTTYSQNQVQANKPVLQQLAAHYPLLLVSNFYGNLLQIIADSGILPLFRSVTDSTIVGIRKPDPAIWQLAISELGYQPKEVMVIGDSYKNDIVPALSLGCPVVQGCSSENDQVPGIPTIQSLQELPSLL